MYSSMRNNNKSSQFCDKAIINKRPSAVSFEWKRIQIYPSIMFYFTWKISITPERENIQAYEITVFSCSEVLGQVSYFLNDNREQVEWAVGIPWNGNSIGEVAQAVVRVKINDKWSDWSDSATIRMISNRFLNNPVHIYPSPPTTMLQRIKGFSSTSMRFQHSLSATDGLVSNLSRFIILFPGTPNYTNKNFIYFGGQTS